MSIHTGDLVCLKNFYSKMSLLDHDSISCVCGYVLKTDILFVLKVTNNISALIMGPMCIGWISLGAIEKV